MYYHCYSIDVCYTNCITPDKYIDKSESTTRRISLVIVLLKYFHQASISTCVSLHVMPLSNIDSNEIFGSIYRIRILTQSLYHII